MCTALKALLCSIDDALPQHWSVLRAIHTHPYQPPKLYLLAGGVVPHPYNAPAQSARSHVGHLGPISASGGHGWLWLCWSMLAIGG